MDLLNSLYISDVLHDVASVLLVPVVICLLLGILYAVYSIGALIVEALTDRRRYRAVIPELLAKVVKADPADLPVIVECSDLLRSQKDDLLELVTYLYLPEDTRTEVARRLLANERDRYNKQTGILDAIAKVAPMLGLMGTLIPLGPGIVALGSGETQTLSDSLLMAFDTTTAGLVTAAVAYLVGKVRKHWYQDYLLSMESVMKAMLELARIAHESGYKFPALVATYDEKGEVAEIEPLEESKKKMGWHHV